MSARKAKFGKRGSKNRGRCGEGEGGGDLPKAEGKYGELFLEYREELDARQDRHERLVKLSRDCTVHSKRTIFTLHQFSGEDGSKDRVLQEAEAKLNRDVLPILHSIASEVRGTDPHRHHYAYSPGVQEFIEALAYYTYLKSGVLISSDKAQEFLTFRSKREDADSDGEREKRDLSKEETQVEDLADRSAESKEDLERRVESETTVLPLTVSDFVLGLADLTGELMRLCINAVGCGNKDLPFTLLPFFRALYTGLHFFGPGLRHMNQKMTTLRSSLGKVESVCYALKVRGSEMPKQMLMDVINTDHSLSQQQPVTD